MIVTTLEIWFAPSLIIMAWALWPVRSRFLGLTYEATRITIIDRTVSRAHGVPAAPEVLSTVPAVVLAIGGEDR